MREAYRVVEFAAAFPAAALTFLVSLGKGNFLNAYLLFVFDYLFFIYTKLFGWFIFSVPNKIQIYGNSMIKYAKKAGVKGKKIMV